MYNIFSCNQINLAKKTFNFCIDFHKFLQKKIKLILLSFLNLYYKYQDTNLVCKNVKKKTLRFTFFKKVMKTMTNNY